MQPAIYARVSTEDQDCEIQLANLREYVRRNGWHPAAEYVEKLSGKEGAKRPQLERLMEDARMKRIDTVLVLKMDRFGRSVLDTLTNIKSLEFYKTRFICPSMNIDTCDQSPVGKFTLTLFAAIAELERAFIVERTNGGFRAYQAAYKAGKVGKDKTRHSKSGKDLPVGRPRLVVDRTRVLALSKSGMSVREIAKKLGLGKSSVGRILKP